MRDNQFGNLLFREPLLWHSMTRFERLVAGGTRGVLRFPRLDFGSGCGIVG